MGRKNLDYSNYAFTEAVNEYIHNKRNREMLILFYVDDVTLYDYLHEKHTGTAMQIKVKQGMYKA